MGVSLSEEDRGLALITALLHDLPSVHFLLLLLMVPPSPCAQTLSLGPGCRQWLWRGRRHGSHLKWVGVGQSPEVTDQLFPTTQKVGAKAGADCGLWAWVVEGISRAGMGAGLGELSPIRETGS